MEDLTTSTQQNTATVTPMTFTEKVTNIFASPAELFDNVRDTVSTPSNWVIPVVLLIIVAFGLSQVIMHNPVLNEQLKVQIRESGEKRLQEQVQQGKITAEQAEQTREQMEAYTDPGKPFFVIMQAVSMIVLMPLVLFAISALYWLLGKSIIKATSPYMKVVEVIGLTFYIGVLETIMTTIIQVAFENLHATPGLGLAVMNGFSAENKLHVALSKVNIFTIWSLIVTSIGLARLFRKDIPKVMVLVFALWILWVVFLLITGFQFGG